MLGRVDAISRNAVIGWAADPARPQDEVFVRVVINGRGSRIAANLLRTDLAAAFPGATGRYGFRLDMGALALSPFIDQAIQVVFGKTGAPIPGGVGRLAALGTPPAAAARAGKPAPLLIKSTGRTGSSLLMARLARHPAIVVAREHPYEVKLLSYYTAALRTLTAAADRDRSTDPETMLADANRFFIGHNPYHDAADAADPGLRHFWSISAPDALRDCFAGLLDAYHAAVAAKAGKLQPRYFAQKAGSRDLVREAAAFMFGPLHEILLVRDPRDIICSARSFWGRDFAASVRTLRGQFASMVTPIADPGLRQHVLRYEDMLLQPQRAMAGVFGFLGLEAADWELDEVAEAAVFTRHGTATAPAQTIGRWRAELTAEEAALATTELRPFLQLFGYEDAGV